MENRSFMNIIYFGFDRSVCIAANNNTIYAVSINRQLLEEKRTGAFQIYISSPKSSRTGSHKDGHG